MGLIDWYFSGLVIGGVIMFGMVLCGRTSQCCEYGC